MAGRIVALLGRRAHLSLQDWRFLLVAAKELAIARITHAVRPVGQILSELQSQQSSTAVGVIAPYRAVDLKRLSWALGAMSARVPWRSDCLLRVMAANRWLRRHGVQPEFYLGVSKTIAGEFNAHAWLRCGEYIVTGGQSDEFVRLLEPSNGRDPQLACASDHGAGKSELV